MKKARTYVRYDPLSGQKVKVTKDDPRYTSWKNRKPSKRSKLQEKILAAPGEYVRERATKVAEESARHAATTAARRLAPYAASGAVTVAGRIAPLALALGVPALVAIAAGAGAYLLSKASRYGYDENQLSREFVAKQRELIQASHVSTWLDVPEAARSRLLSDYKASLQRIEAVRQATLPSTANRNRKG